MENEFRILIVDDNADLASNLFDILESNGYKITIANDGAQAIKLCRDNFYHLSLVDINLPDYTGVDLIDKLSEINEEMEYIIITAHGSIETAIIAARKKNIVSYEMKPIDFNRFLSSIQQIRERKVAELKFKESEKTYRNIIENMQDVYYRTDIGGNLLMVSPSGAELFTYDNVSEMIGLNIATHFYVIPEQRSEFLKILERDGKIKNFEVQMKRKDGSFLTIISNSNFYYDSNGKISGVEGVITDITERKNAEEIIHTQLNFRENVEKFYKAIQHSLDFETMMSKVLDTALEVFNCDRAWFLFPCNPEAKSWSVPMERTRNSYPGAMAMGVEIPMLPEAQEVFRLALSNEEPIPYDPTSNYTLPPETSEQFNILSQIIVAIHPRKGDPWLLGLHQCSEARIWTLEDIKLFKEFGRMITDSLSSMLFLKDLLSSEEKYSSVVENSTDAIIIHLDGIIKFANTSAKNLTGYELDEFVDNKILQFIPEKFHGTVLKNYSDRLKGKKVPNIYEIEVITKEGVVLPVEINATIINYFESPAALVFIRDISVRKKAEEELNLYKDHLESLVNERTKELDILNKKLERELQIQKEAEKAVKTALQREQELNEIKTHFVSMVSHEFRTPLTTILASADLLEMVGDKWDSDKKINHIRKIQRSVDNMRIMLEEVLTLSRVERGKIKFNPSFVNFKNICANATNDAKNIISGKHNIVLNYKNKMENFYLDEMLISYILSNLLSNAIKFSPQGGDISLSINGNDKNLVFEVSDNGMGIDENEKEIIFRPFKRGEKVSNIQGSGLGLTIVKEAVEMHRGTITVNSQINEGSTFRVSIPTIFKTKKNFPLISL